MLSSLSTVLATACLIVQTLASPASGKALSRRQDNGTPAAPIPPLQDPWYSAPDGFESAKPGDVLRIREAPGNLTSLTSNCSSAYNILYRTTNSQYKPDWAVTTVFVPVSASPALLSYQVPYDSAWLDASPSYAFYSSDGARYLPDISTGLSSGWFVNVPDYEGPLASFTAGVMSGHATIDSIRAAFNANETLGLDPDARYAMWGYSGGALASEWAAELQVQYAPEMNFGGAAIGGLTPNVTSVLYSINTKLAAGLAPSSILGLSSQYPEERAYLLSRLKTEGPFNATGFLAALNYTVVQAARAYAFQDMGEYFVGGITDITTDLVLRIINRDGIMGYHGVPEMPIFSYKAVEDEISVVQDTDALMEKYCNIGANILYQRNTVGDHGDEAVNGRPSALAWLSSVLGGTYAEDYSASGCTTTTVTIDLTNTTASKRSLQDEPIWFWVD
ncbi:hypothetical protein KVR01_009124 [Diaporthe batatas]|uniref:uncharacterized protein n=1 Tax=Diaporthe batatas TaxID=748121 RepID=UPI001D036E84|nr:uncharacterized protein KVR01_009124 [Diaporthe batatas]KAG8160860.1 hypothetical protein KVR01_009124 [Diaporthe batatas]